MSDIKCNCGRIVPPLSVISAIESESNLKCTSCSRVIRHEVLRNLSSRVLVRSCHPETSREAAQHIQSKLRETQLRALKFVRESPGSTANELAVIANDRDNRKIGRRLPELERMGLIERGDPRPCEVTRRNATVWNPV